MTRPYAEVIGDPIAHSKSPIIHNFWLQKLGIDAEYRAAHVRTEELAAYFMQRRKDANWRGCNVTMPHKQAVRDFLDTVSRQTSLIDAVNCIYEQQGRLVGENTDVDGVAEPLGTFPVTAGRGNMCTSVQIVGCGGAASAAYEGAARAGYSEFEVFARDLERARTFAQAMGASSSIALPLAELQPHFWADGMPASHVLINATPMGMAGTEAVPVDLSGYGRETIVFDMVYAPLETPLLKQARALGLRTIDGLSMLISQAAEAFRLFFGQVAPREHDDELRRMLVK